MEENKKKQWIRIGSIFGILVLLIGIAYAWITLTIQGQKEHVLKVGSLELVLNESSEAINIEKAIPISDSEGQALTGFTFTLENTGVLDSDYTIYLDDVELEEGETRLADSNIKFSLEKNGEAGTPTLLSETGENPNRILDTGSLKRQEKNTYILRIWLADTSSGDIAGQVMKTKLRIEAIQSQSKPGAESLLAKVNSEDLDYNSATSEQQKEMWTFSHTAGSQQAGWTSEELTDYRYIGSNPNNYITFNDEVWRIIGVFTVEDAEGNKAKRMKIIRNDFLSTSLAWDSSNSNVWETASLKTILNEDYFNKKESYVSNGLSKTSQDQIDSVKWYLGGTDDALEDTGTASSFYNSERETTVYNGATFWIGKIALMYVSDYGYATGYVFSASATSCNSIDMDYWNNSSYEVCRTNDWLYNSSYNQWTLSSYSKHNQLVFYIDTIGRYNRSYTVKYSYAVRPAVYLRSDIEITGGTGSSTDPYTIGS